MWRMIRSWICHNHKFYYTYVILCAMGVYNFWWNTCVGYYRRRNYHRSLDFAIQREQEWNSTSHLKKTKKITVKKTTVQKRQP